MAVARGHWRKSRRQQKVSSFFNVKTQFLTELFERNLFSSVWLNYEISCNISMFDSARGSYLVSSSARFVGARRMEESSKWNHCAYLFVLLSRKISLDFLTTWNIGSLPHYRWATASHYLEHVVIISSLKDRTNTTKQTSQQATSHS